LNTHNALKPFLGLCIKAEMPGQMTRRWVDRIAVRQVVWAQIRVTHLVLFYVKEWWRCRYSPGNPRFFHWQGRPPQNPVPQKVNRR
jgi:hypothetical protein